MATKSHKAKVWMHEAMRTQIPELEDRYGNFKSTEGTLRIKMNKTSWRLETRRANHWYKLTGKFYTRTVWKDVIQLIKLLNTPV